MLAGSAYSARYPHSVPRPSPAFQTRPNANTAAVRAALIYL